MSTISRYRTLLRAKFGWEEGTVEFSKTKMHPTGYLCNATGYLSMIWGIPRTARGFNGGLSTLMMDVDEWAYEIKPQDLKLGDALGLLGPGSVDIDGGTLVYFEQFGGGDPNSGYVVVWQHLAGTSPGPVRRAMPLDKNRWHSYRFRDIVD